MTVKAALTMMGGRASGWPPPSAAGKSREHDLVGAWPPQRRVTLSCLSNAAG